MSDAREGPPLQPGKSKFEKKELQPLLYHCEVETGECGDQIKV